MLCHQSEKWKCFGYDASRLIGSGCCRRSFSPSLGPGGSCDALCDAPCDVFQTLTTDLSRRVSLLSEDLGDVAGGGWASL